MRGRRLHRLLQVIALLRGPASWNARKLSEHFHTSRRNIHRDLAVLELAGIPFHYDPDFGEGGGYRIRESFFFPNVGLTDQECFDLAVVTRLVEDQDIPLLEDISHVRDKLFGTLPAKQQTLIAEASALFEALSTGQAKAASCRQALRSIQEAVLTRKQVGCVYREASAAIRLQLQPRRIFLCGHCWWLAAEDNKEGQTRLFRLSRFESIKVLDRPMTVDASFSLQDFLGNAWSVQRGDREFHVEIHFTVEAALSIQDFRWHRTQETERQRDGSLLFRATVGGLDEIKYWVLGWGPQAKVLKRRPWPTKFDCWRKKPRSGTASSRRRSSRPDR